MKTIKHTYIILFLFGTTINAQVINFPDINFKNRLIQITNATYLNGQVGRIDINQNGEVEISEAHNIKGLGNTVNSANISDLTGLEFFINLKVLYLSTNQITQFNFPTLSLLEHLYLGFNPLTSFNLSNHPNMKFLNIHDTQISQLIFPPSNLLEEFGGNNQPLSAINIRDNPNLRLLKIHNTNISTINIKNTNINFTHAGMLWDCWANIPLTYICCDAEDVPALTTFLTNCGHNLSAITIDTTNTCALSQSVVNNYGIKIYPNPSTGLFNLNLPAVFNAEVSVFNTLGQKVYETSFKNEQNVVLDLGLLHKGLYILKVKSEEGQSFEEKVILAP